MTNKGLCKLLFEGREKIGFKDIMDMKESFRQELWHYEFHTYGPDPTTGNITVEAFLKSLAICLHADKVERYIRRIPEVVNKV